MESIRAELDGVLSEVLGHGHGVSGARIAKIRASLLPLFRSLPKNNKGHLSEHVMRYAVRRYFRQEHGWIVKGFEPHAEQLNASESSGDIIQGKVPAYIRTLLEERFAHDGFALEDVVATVAALERLTFDEVVDSVESCFWLNDKSVMDALSHTEMMDVLSSYLIINIFGASTDKKRHTLIKKNVLKLYPHWSTTFLFLTDIAGSDTFQQSFSANPFVEGQKFYFSDLTRMAERVSEEFGPWSAHECHDMKDALVEKDVHGSGRVKLADFYKKSQDGAWAFTEPTEYLRQLGALDESSPSHGPQVLIPNYINALSQCIATGPYYSICCLNECDQIYERMEALIPASTANAMEILRVVESMPQSPSISAPLRDKLDEVAQTHNGNIPLHSRLVAQWLHFAFPHECPYPHEAGTISPKSSDEFSAENGGPGTSYVKEDEIKQVIEMYAGRHHVSAEHAMISWTTTESLLVASTPSDESDRAWPKWLRITAQLCIVISCLALVLRELNRLLHPDKKKAVEYDV